MATIVRSNAEANKIGALVPDRGMKNYIINGGFDIWQRGTWFDNTSDEYYADRWRTGVLGSEARVRQLINQSAVNGATFGLGINIDGESSVQFYSRIENPENIRNKTMTLSFQVSGEVATRFEYVGIIIRDGIGGEINLLSNAVSITTTATKQSFTFDVGDLSGIDLTEAGKYAQVTFRVPNGLTTEIMIWQVQLEEGSVATPFEQRPIGLELSLCQRYYERSAASIHWGTKTNSSVYMYNSIHHYKVSKRAVPTLDLTINTNVDTQINTQNTDLFSLRNTGTTSDADDWYYEFTADAEL